ncbi:glutathione S-transferase omega-1-like [Mizuhopecten yessoensis]|uniref:Glutathione S-transferase omega n=1 Tax=Mizuhopecten yessoensis TaxID=6573 RepID=A0A210PFW8_MIZYE|nr:glutathione S-transferase omega-1-like [Mizuhopecten yessoensis]OWF35357.1 Glutathione S-transferase omega-1 [Mizuhopecten yessoensis]
MSSLKSHSKDSKLPALTPGKLRLYSMRFCPFAQRTRLVLVHKKIEFETVNVDLKAKPDWFLERNPLGLVPVLEQDDKVLYESVITCDYLDDVYPDNKLNPSDPYQRARDRILLESYGKVVTNYYGTFRSQGKDKEILENLWKSLTPFEKAIGERGTYFGGDKPTMLDYFVWPWFERMGVFSAILPGVDPMPAKQFPKLTAWVEVMKSLPAVKETMFDIPTHVAFYKGYAAGKPDYDVGL